MPTALQLKKYDMDLEDWRFTIGKFAFFWYIGVHHLGVPFMFKLIP